MKKKDEFQKIQSERKKQWELENKGNTKVKNEDKIIETIYIEEDNSEKIARIDILKGNSDLNKELKEDYYALGKKAYKLKKYYHAVEHYSNALQYYSENPKLDANLHYSRSKAKKELDDLKGAEEDAAKAIELGYKDEK